MHNRGVCFDFVFQIPSNGDMAGAKVGRQWDHHRVYFSPFTSSSVRSGKKDLVTVHININEMQPHAAGH